MELHALGDFLKHDFRRATAYCQNSGIAGHALDRRTDDEPCATMQLQAAMYDFLQGFARKRFKNRNFAILACCYSSH